MAVIDGNPIELTVLFPCLNEAETLAGCVRGAHDVLKAHDISAEVLVVDNGSTDASADIARGIDVRIIQVPARGYGHAIREGIAAARGRYVIMLDADGSYDPAHIPCFLDRLRAGDELVMGNRFQGGIHTGAMPWLHRYVGNPLLSALGRLLYGSSVRDFHCGLRGFARASIARLDLRATGMEIASEMVVKAALEGLRVNQIPTTLSPDGRSRTPHLRTWRDGLRHLGLLLRLAPRRWRRGTARRRSASYHTE